MDHLPPFIVALTVISVVAALVAAGVALRHGLNFDRHRKENGK